MDLFHQRVEQSQLTHVVIDPELDLGEIVSGFDDPNFGVIEANDDGIDPTPAQLDLDLGLGVYGEQPASPNDGFVEENFDNSEVHFVTGLQLVDAESDSCSDLNVDFDIALNAEEEEYGEGDDDPSELLLCWDSFQMEDHTELNEEFEWEEVDRVVDGREVLNMFLDDDDAVSVATVPREERVGVLGNLEWEVMLNVLNLDANAAEAFIEFGVGDSAEYDIFFEQFVGSENAMMGKPPAAKQVVKDLPEVVLSKDELEKNNVICAICKDEMGVGEAARQLPCNHKYHGDCILPWLGIRNTCPVCRYALPTDNPDYERRRERVAGHVN